MVDRCALMHAYGMNMRACVHTYGVNRCTSMWACGVKRCTCVHSYGLNNRALEVRLMGEKHSFFGDFNVFYGQDG
jgi:hypothetical protein